MVGAHSSAPAWPVSRDLVCRAIGSGLADVGRTQCAPTGRISAGSRDGGAMPREGRTQCRPYDGFERDDWEWRGGRRPTVEGRAQVPPLRLPAYVQPASTGSAQVSAAASARRGHRAGMGPLVGAHCVRPRLDPVAAIYLKRRQAGLVLEEPRDVGLEQQRRHAAAGRLGKIVSLCQVAVDVSQPAGLCRRLDPFRHDAQPE